MSVDLLTYVEKPSVPHVVAKDARTDEWRTHHLDAAQWSTACGYDLDVEPIDLFAQFTGVAPIADLDELATAIEAGMRALAARHLGREIAPSPTFLHPRHEWSSSSPHGLCDDGSALLVATTFIDDSAFDAPPTIESWGTREEDVPVRVLVRAMGVMTVVRAWQMAHTASAPLMSNVHVAAIVGSGFRLHRVAWDEDFARRLFDRVARFWAGVKVGQPPPKRDTEAFYAYAQKRYPQHTSKKWIEADDALKASIVGWSRVDAQIQELKRQRQAAKNEICARIGDAEGVRGVDENGLAWRLPWRAVRGPRTLNKTLLETALHDLLGRAETTRILDLSTKQGEGYRKLGPEWRAKPKKSLHETREQVLADEDQGSEP